jgi:acyl dehydratase
MPIDYETLLNWRIPEVRQRFTSRDTMLYALGVGLGADPLAPKQLRFVYEKNLQALPTMACVVGYPGRWHAQPGTGVTATHTVLADQSFIIHKPLPVEGTVISRSRLVSLVDKGAGRGALITTESTVSNADNGDLLFVATQSTYCRADGGFGGPAGPARPWRKVPDTAAHHVCDIVTLPQSALIYRLSGDYHELHADPDYARIAGFEKPILPGRCTFSIAGLAILKTCCDYDPLHFKSMAGRFSAPAYPGETIRTELWRDGNSVAFRASVPARGVVVLDCGQAQVAA